MILKETTVFCKSCFEEIKINTLHAFLHSDICLCNKCFQLLEPKLIKDEIDGVKGIYIYFYNEKIKEKIYTLKGCGDIELAQIFLNYYLPYLKIKYKGFKIIPAPSNINDDIKREFNHVIEIFKPLNLPFLQIIKKKKEFKQSDLKRKDREKIIENLYINDIEKISNEKILFVDDISTTSSTLKACLKLIKQGNPKKLKFLIIAKVNNNRIVNT